MFIYSLRASTLKFFAVVCLALTTLVTLIAFIPEYDGGSLDNVSTSGKAEINYEKIKDGEDVVRFLTQFGWEVSAEPVEVCEVEIPENFDKVFAGYNEIQKGQGLDLAKYKGKKVDRYTYKITNYEGSEDTVYANVLVYRKKVIGGDVCSANVTGFIHGFEK